VRIEVSRTRRGVYIVWFGFAVIFRTDTASCAEPTPEENRQVVLSEPEREWEQQHPVVHWGVDPQWPPFSSFDKQGRIRGIDVEIAKLLARRTGLNIQFVKTASWSETLQKASAGEIDLVVGIARTEKRERLLGLRFSEVFCNFPTVIVTRKDEPFLTLMRELETRRVALPRDYATTEKLQRLHPNAHILLTSDEEEAMLAVAGKRADATGVNIASASYIAHMRGLSNLKISGFSECDFFLSVAVRKDAPELYSIVQKGLATIEPKEKEAIYASFINPGTSAAITWEVWRRRLIYSLAAGVAVLTGLLLWNRVLVREISRRKDAEACLRQAKARLEERARELAQYARQMEILNSKLTLANKDLEAFSYSVSHDLKAPLRHVRSFADMLELEADRKLDSTSRHCVQSIQREGRRMSELIEALLALAQVGRVKLQLSQVDLKELVREVINDLHLEAEGREVDWQVQLLPKLDCDRGLMKQVFANLLGNAAKFTRGRKPAVIKIGLLPEKPGDREVVVFVKDNGAGFDKNRANTLFEPFRRLHRYSEFEGSGIGLANVKRIILRHGGRVWAEGEVNSGATFYFSLPRQPVVEQGATSVEDGSVKSVVE
jgi:signal transduction histidine kinase